MSEQDTSETLAALMHVVRLGDCGAIGMTEIERAFLNGAILILDMGQPTR